MKMTKVTHNQLVNPKKLHILSTLAQYQTLTKAAEALNLSQPALSNSLSSLESFFSLKLHEVIGRKIHLTEAGHMVLKHWQSIETAYQALHDELGALKEGEAGEIFISIVSTAKYFIPSVIKYYLKARPNVRIHCEISHRDLIIEKIENRMLDLAILTEPPRLSTLHCQPLGKNPLVFVAHPENTLTHKKNVKFEEIAEQPYITRESSAQITQNLIRFFEIYKVKPKVLMSFNSTEALKESVIEKLGIALVPRFSVDREIKAGLLRIIPFDTSELTNNWYAVHALSKPLTKSANHFVAQIKKHFSKG